MQWLLQSSTPATTPWAVLWAQLHSFPCLSEANRKPKSIQLNQKQNLLLLYGVLIGNTNSGCLLSLLHFVLHPQYQQPRHVADNCTKAAQLSHFDQCV